MAIPRWGRMGALAIFFTIFGYILYNVAIIEIGSAFINVSLMNILAGVVSFILFRSEIKSRPIWWISLLGACSFVCIVFGLHYTHQSLKDPSSAIEVVYDFLVISSVGLWAIIEKPLGLPHTKIRKFDIFLHLCMALLVSLRLAVHWQAGWSPRSFLPVLLAVSGYWLFNVAIRLAQKKPKSTRATAIGMNIIGGLIFLLIALVNGGNLNFNMGMLLGAASGVIIIFSLGKAYQFLAPHGLSPLVVAGTYDGLLILAPIAMWLIYRQTFLFTDILITAGFIIVMTTRVYLYSRGKISRRN